MSTTQLGITSAAIVFEHCIRTRHLRPSGSAIVYLILTHLFKVQIKGQGESIVANIRIVKEGEFSISKCRCLLALKT